jgi:hypothetical protein
VVDRVVVLALRYELLDFGLFLGELSFKPIGVGFQGVYWWNML